MVKYFFLNLKKKRIIILLNRNLKKKLKIQKKKNIIKN